MRRLLLAALVLAVLVPSSRADVEKKAIAAAIERGVAFLRSVQRPDGSYNHTAMGATALAGIALIESGVARDDRAVQAAADYVRKNGLSSNHIYSLSLAVIFLDRLGERGDTPLIESMIVRLLSGQQRKGGWGYFSANVGAEEMKRIKGEMDGTRVLRAGGDLKKLPAAGKRTVKDLPADLLARINGIGRGVGIVDGIGDNSNTQFAVLALWTGRRYGVPTQPALVRAYEHFRTTQGKDGTWGYSHMTGPILSGTATMTCAGILGLAVGQGAAVEIKKAAGGKADSADVSKDISLRAGLLALSAVVGKPLGWDGVQARPAALPAISGKMFYYLWSLERICVALGLRTVGKKDWYNWGAELLLANQQRDGSWRGEYEQFHADTCFALLFLKKANLTNDLGEKLAGLRDPGEKILKAGGVGGDFIKTRPKPLALPGVGEKKKPVVAARERPPARNATERSARELADGLRAARGEAREAMLRKLRDSKGVAYTEALAQAIPLLEGDARREARRAFTLRLSRMSDGTLGDYLADEDAEIRRAAALAVGTKGTRAHLGRLVKMLRDGSSQVRKAAHAALKELTGKALGADPEAWEKWWKEKGRE